MRPWSGADAAPSPFPKLLMGQHLENLAGWEAWVQTSDKNEQEAPRHSFVALQG